MFKQILVGKRKSRRCSCMHSSDLRNNRLWLDPGQLLFAGFRFFSTCILSRNPRQHLPRKIQTEWNNFSHWIWCVMMASNWFEYPIQPPSGLHRNEHVHTHGRTHSISYAKYSGRRREVWMNNWYLWPMKGKLITILPLKTSGSRCCCRSDTSQTSAIHIFN